MQVQLLSVCEWVISVTVGVTTDRKQSGELCLYKPAPSQPCHFTSLDQPAAVVGQSILYSPSLSSTVYQLTIGRGVTSECLVGIARRGSNLAHYSD